jgi:hypothetical protein
VAAVDAAVGTLLREDWEMSSCLAIRRMMLACMTLPLEEVPVMVRILLLAIQAY